MLQRFRSLTQREQALLGGLAAFLLVLVAVFGIAAPVIRFQHAATEDYARAQRVARLAESLEPAAEGPADDRALRSVVTERADRRKIVYTRLNSLGDGGLQIDLADVPHDAFFAWLEDLDAEENIIVAEAYVAPGEKADTVEARLTLTRAE